MRLLIFGLGFCGKAVAREAMAAGWEVAATSRTAVARAGGVRTVRFDDAAAEIAAATHILVTAPPGEGGDPVLARYAPDIGAAPGLSWIGYLSTTGVYGDRRGGWVDETTKPAPTADRSHRRLAAEQAWRACAAGRPLDIFRLAGIYGPGRSALDDVRGGRARRVIAPGHAFGRIHVDDIAAAVMAAIARPPEGVRVLNLSDDEPAESAAVIAEAALLLGAPVPPAVPFEQAVAGMSEMARSFWAENRRVDSRLTRRALGIAWRYPSYREGLRAILREERGDDAAQQIEVPLA
jgi:nucleoside-diphosphate-sugar epimerase